MQDLANVTFQAKLGSYLEKTHRVVVLVKELGGDAHAERAALLSKTDLTTELVKEFTELQGIIGGLYASAQGEPEEVATAIYDHYKPVSMEDSIPRTQTAQLVAIADKLDTLRGCFGIGMIPTGSKDPFALRRAAQGIVKIIVEGKLRLPIRRLLGSDAALEEFFLDRVRYYFREIRGFKYDEVKAVLAAGSDDLVDVEERLTAVRESGQRRISNLWPPAFKRISNILRQAHFQADGTVLNRALLEAGPEARTPQTDCRRQRGSSRPSRLRLQTRAHSLSSSGRRPFLRQSHGERRRSRRSPKPAGTAPQRADRIFHHRGFFRNRNYLSGEQMSKNVYSFGGGTADGNGKMKDILGGKGAGLAEMCRAGLPVPAGFTIATQVCNIYFDNKKQIPEEINTEIDKALVKLEKTMGQKLGDPNNPMLLSVRSGAKFSMPGMMNTILNLGLNDETTAGLAKKSNNPRFAYDCYRRFIQMFGEVALDIEMEKFDHIFDARKHKVKAKSDTDLTAEDLQAIIVDYKKLVQKETEEALPAGSPRTAHARRRRRVRLLVER